MTALRLRHRAPGRAVVAAAALVAAGAALAAGPAMDGILPPPADADAPPASTGETPRIVIVGSPLLPGFELPLRRIPVNAQTFPGAEMRRRGVTLTEFLESDATGIGVAAVQGNPYQPDVVLRGFSASPVLGTPQGISVFVDGVRVNEPFGDAVNWDLIPASAIDRVEVVPGSNPAYGLNTLGGAIAVTTRRGRTAYPERPGGTATAWGGSFGRRSLALETGGRSDPWDWFVAADAADERGWAEHNPSRLRQAFAKVGWQDDRTDVRVSLQAADNRLEGTQTLPPGFDDPRQAYTWPDVNRNRLSSVAIAGHRQVGADWRVAGNAYVRRLNSRNLSSNVVDDPDAAPAANDAAAIVQRGRGAALQLAREPSGGACCQLTFGASIDTADARYTRASQPAAFTADRGTVGLDDFETEVDADATTRRTGLFASAVVGLGERWSLTLALRHDRAAARIADRSGSAPDLDGSHRFGRTSPAVGLSFHPDADFTAWASYNEGMRAPTAIELTCADPAAPCKLPNNFIADPPLRQVVSRTAEWGVRTKDRRFDASAAVFVTELRDDLQFVASDGLANNAGYFRNVGTTRRLGVELGAGVRRGAFSAALHYAFVDATYRSGFRQSSPSNSTADATGAIDVMPGARIPGVARHRLQLRVETGADTGWSAGARVVAASGSFARGDENNRDANGRIGGYAVVGLDGRWRLTPRAALLARVDNLFDRDHSTFGALGRNVFAGPDHGFDRSTAQPARFTGHGAPRGAWVGMELGFE